MNFLQVAGNSSQTFKLAIRKVWPMANCWIFVSFPFSDFNKGNISEMMEKIKQSGKWAIGKNTSFRRSLSKGDSILFYQAGEEGKKFVGSGSLLSGLQSNEDSISNYVAIGNIDFWEKPVPVTDVLNNLSFVKDKNRWGFYFKGGIVRLPQNDYEYVLQKARRKRIRARAALFFLRSGPRCSSKD